MFEHDHSAARGKMAVRELIVFQHDSELGCAPAWKLFEAVHVTRRDSGALPPPPAPIRITPSRWTRPPSPPESPAGGWGELP